jgi:hypothetical protein
LPKGCPRVEFRPHQFEGAEPTALALFEVAQESENVVEGFGRGEGRLAAPVTRPQTKDRATDDPENAF